jgi:hypothetical protein
MIAATIVRLKITLDDVKPVVLTGLEPAPYSAEFTTRTSRSACAKHALESRRVRLLRGIA